MYTMYYHDFVVIFRRGKIETYGAGWFLKFNNNNMYTTLTIYKFFI